MYVQSWELTKYVVGELLDLSTFPAHWNRRVAIKPQTLPKLESVTLSIYEGIRIWILQFHKQLKVIQVGACFPDL
jgi:hypothetical protein